ncbi:two-component system sensor histidine kinase KdpD [Streptosporangium becharense]|uniref:histidine kinase n=1 Tax=Streptosporangium becharense TaxID=1816182 RepID=A0A7W9IBX7_9ACTN|nr:sensor histidine kinase KdpD [Streptosporangium becharense]MBB2910679.1 two-component system sensor histidine kinase KdpD [Streptosporangium becharense]MBB5817374.1 two-component system sensor histidine kinase KdpD [Streptosporangium becharense]
MRGRLRVYLGAAPGVGKTYAMLSEGRRALARGRDVVVGFVETHGRARTADLLEGMEVIPRATLVHRGTAFTELDVAAVLARAPKVALIDELAHTNVPGSRNAKRWQDVEEILDAGIDVVSTVNIQHLESLNDVVRQITGIPQRETVPDEVVRRADQIELVDMSPEALRRRMAHGNVYAPEKVDAALSNYFRLGNLTALRELALLWVAGKVDEQLDRYRAEHGIAATWEARERVVVALSGGPEGDTLLRRASRIAARTKGADLLAVHVTPSDGLTGGDPAHLVRQRGLVESMGGSYHQVVGDDIPRALLDFARGVNATQLVLGASRRGRFAQLLLRGVGVETTALSGSIDVHLVTHEEARKGRTRPERSRAALTRKRRLIGWTVAAAGMPLLTAALLPLRDAISLPSEILLFLCLVVGVALIGGARPAITTAVGGSLLINWFFTPPVGRFTIAAPENLLALVVFVLVAAAVSAIVDLAARRTREAVRARADAEVLSTLAGHVLRGEAALPSLIERLRETFALDSVTLLERAGEPTPDDRSEPAAWRIVATSGAAPCTSPATADTDVGIGDDLVLAARGRLLDAGDRRVLEAFAAEAAVALRQQRLREEAEQARPLAEVDRMRTALLAAVSHDLRTPLSAAKAAVESLRGHDIDWSPEDRDELLATADESLARLERLVENLLDMSRLQAGVLGLSLQPVALEEVVPRVIDDLGPLWNRVEGDIPVDLPEIAADPALLERVLVNLATNAVRHNPPDLKVSITASRHDDAVEIRVVDRGPGIPSEDHERVFLPFQRLGDRDNGTGVGLGLALSRGLTEAMGGTLVPEETPGGGLTMIIRMPVTSGGDAMTEEDDVPAPHEGGDHTP